MLSRFHTTSTTNTSTCSLAIENIPRKGGLIVALGTEPERAAPFQCSIRDLNKFKVLTVNKGYSISI